MSAKDTCRKNKYQTAPKKRILIVNVFLIKLLHLNFTLKVVIYFSSSSSFFVLSAGKIKKF